MYDAWNLHKPKLLISVTGGAKNFKMKLNIKNAFKKAIIKAAISTDAWLVTGGTEEGIMKIIGEAFRESTIRLGDRKKLVLLGISNWTTIRNNHLLARKVIFPDYLGRMKKVFNKCYKFLTKGEEPCNYKRDDEEYQNHPDFEFVIKDKGTYLDSNHTHFLLVDTSQLNMYGGEIEFRAKLLDHICDPDLDDSNEIPMIVLVVGKFH